MSLSATPLAPSSASWRVSAGMIVGFAFIHWVTIAKEDASRLWSVPLLISIVAVIAWWRLPTGATTARLAVGAAMGGWLAAWVFGATFTLDSARMSPGAWLALGHPAWRITGATWAAIALLATGVVRSFAEILPVEHASRTASRIFLALVWGSLVGTMLLATHGRPI